MRSVRLPITNGAPRKNSSVLSAPALMAANRSGAGKYTASAGQRHLPSLRRLPDPRLERAELASGVLLEAFPRVSVTPPVDLPRHPGSPLASGDLLGVRDAPRVTRRSSP